MSDTVRIPEIVLQARERIAEGRERLKERHRSGAPGIQLSTQLTDLVDAIVLDLYHDALQATDPEIEKQIALVPYGGYGRRDLAPYSDVDLMLLHAPGESERIAPFVRMFTQNIYDVGFELGFSVRTPRQTCNMSLQDVTIFTSLVESRFLGGSAGLFARFMSQFKRTAHRRSLFFLNAIEESRREERRKYGETVFMLRPNVKRSLGALRDVHMVRWIGFAKYQECEPESLKRIGVLTREDRRRLRRSREFLIRLRNELHFSAGRSQDVLDREEQVRLAELLGYEGHDGLLPVEVFMRDYFERTSEIRYIVSHFSKSARLRKGWRKLISTFSHQVEGDFRVGPLEIQATKAGKEKLAGDLAQVLRLMDLSNLYNKRIGHETWIHVRNAMMDQAHIELSPDAIRRFLSLLSQPAQLGTLLRRLHEMRVLERIIPAVSHARCLLQWNDYHKYTVDEHSIRAVEAAIQFGEEDSPVGDAYRAIKDKRILHLALLLHDLGKGFTEDHSEVGARIAEETAKLLGLSSANTELLRFLVHKHLIMAHMALRNDLSDESTIVKLAVEVGSPDALQMLFVLTCADLEAVGPGVLNDWKSQLIAQLYRRTWRHLTGELPPGSKSDHQKNRRREILAAAENEPDIEWLEQLVDSLPENFIYSDAPEEIAQQIGQLGTLEEGHAVAWGRFLPERNAVEYTVCAHERFMKFHRIVGALSSCGNQILAAEINGIADGLAIDQFFVHDLDFNDEPPAERLEEVSQKLIKSIVDDSGAKPIFRTTWKAQTGAKAAEFKPLPTRVRFDNATSSQYTIISLFAYDKMGLLFRVAKTLSQLGLSIQVAKIGTYLDQVVDVFYVQSETGEKVYESRYDEIEDALRKALDRVDAESPD